MKNKANKDWVGTLPRKPANYGDMLIENKLEWYEVRRLRGAKTTDKAGVA